jgi:hypothetical protein
MDTSVWQGDDENSLACVIGIAYFAAKNLPGLSRASFGSGVSRRGLSAQRRLTAEAGLVGRIEMGRLDRIGRRTNTAETLCSAFGEGQRKAAFGRDKLRQEKKRERVMESASTALHVPSPLSPGKEVKSRRTGPKNRKKRAELGCRLLFA